MSTQPLPILPMEKLARRDDGGEWSQIGGKFVYRVKCWPDLGTVEHLATIKPTNDGRWRWWQRPSDFHKGWRHRQGVAPTATDAAVLAVAASPSLPAPPTGDEPNG